MADSLNIVYNFYQWLFTDLVVSGFTYWVDDITPGSPENLILLTDNGGPGDEWYDRIDYSITINVRSRNALKAKTAASNVYSFIQKRFGKELPAITINDGDNDVIFPAVKTYKISPIQTPGHLGVDDRGLSLYSFNVVITTK